MEEINLSLFCVCFFLFRSSFPNFTIVMHFYEFSHTHTSGKQTLLLFVLLPILIVIIAVMVYVFIK